MPSRWHSGVPKPHDPDREPGGRPAQAAGQGHMTGDMTAPTPRRAPRQNDRSRVPLMTSQKTRTRAP